LPLLQQPCSPLVSVFIDDAALNIGPSLTLPFYLLNFFLILSQRARHPDLSARSLFYPVSAALFTDRRFVRWRTSKSSCWEPTSQNMIDKAIDQWLAELHWSFKLMEALLGII